MIIIDLIIGGIAVLCILLIALLIYGFLSVLIKIKIPDNWLIGDTIKTYRILENMPQYTEEKKIKYIHPSRKKLVYEGDDFLSKISYGDENLSIEKRKNNNEIQQAIEYSKELKELQEKYGN